MKGKLLFVALVALTIAAATPATAHGINSQGVATLGEQAYRAWVSADPVPGDDETFYRCRVLIVDALGAIIVDTSFQCRSNWNHDGMTDPAYVGMAFADGAESNTDFRIDGVQHAPVIHATGHYLDYQLALSFNLVPA